MRTPTLGKRAPIAYLHNPHTAHTYIHLCVDHSSVHIKSIFSRHVYSAEVDLERQTKLYRWSVDIESTRNLQLFHAPPPCYILLMYVEYNMVVVHETV